MKKEGSIALFQYWNRLRGARRAPQRAEIEPADIKTLLADTFILEKDARGEPVFRLAGTRLCATFGRELKGYSFPLIWALRDQRTLSRLAHSAFHDKTVIFATFDGVSQDGKINPFEMVLLPLEGGGGSPRGLGAIMPLAKPYWLGSDPVVEGRIDSLRVVDPDRDPVFLANRPAMQVPPIAPGEAQMVDTRIVESDRGRRIRHLVVFDGGRES